MEDKKKKLTTVAGAPVANNNDIMTAGKRGPLLMQDVWLVEKLAHFDREVIPERRMHAKGSGAFGTFTVTNDITRFTKAKIFSEIGKQTECFVRFSTVAGERGAADAERDIRGFAVKLYTEEGNWDSRKQYHGVSFSRSSALSGLNHAVKRDHKEIFAAPTYNWDFGVSCPKRYISYITMSDRGIPLSYSICMVKMPHLLPCTI
jgi:catalase